MKLVTDDRGAMVIMSLFTTTFLVGLVWYLVGVGDALVFHEKLQDAADAIAFAPSVVHARGMNLIALVNLVMAATLAVLIAVKAVQILLFAANVIACLAEDYGDCAFLSAEESPYAEFVQQIDSDVSRLHRTLYQTNKGIAMYTPLVAAQHAVMVSKDWGNMVQGGFEASISLIPGSVEGGIGGQLTDQGGQANSNRYGLPVEDDDYSNLCVHAGVEGTGIIPILWEPVRRSALAEIESTVREYAGGLELAVAAAYPRAFCGSGSLPSTGPLKMLGKSASKVTDEVCEAIPSRSTRKSCSKGIGSAVAGFQAASSMGSSGGGSSTPVSLRLYRPAAIGDDYFASWGVSTSDVVTKDDAEKGVAIALDRKRIPSGGQLKNGELDRTLRESQIAKSEFYYDTSGGQSEVTEKGMWNLRWTARLRRVHEPNRDLARLLTGPGEGYIIAGAAGSGADVGRLLDNLVAISPEDLAQWSDTNVGKLDATRSTGGMVH